MPRASLLVGLLAFAAASASAEGRRFDAGGFSIAPPPGWTRVELERGKGVTSATWAMPPAASNKGALSVTWYEGAPLTEDAAREATARCEGGDESTKWRQSSLTLGADGPRAWQSICTNALDAQGRRAHVVTSEVVGPARVTVLCAIAPSAWAQVEPLCRAALRSLKVSAPKPRKGPKPSAYDEATPPAPAGGVPLLR